MKAKVQEAFARMQANLRDSDTHNIYPVEVDEDDLRLVLKWAEGKGLAPDLLEDDRVELSARSFLHYWSGTTFGKGAKGTVYQVFDHGKEVRVVWDDDPMEEKEPVYIETKDLRRIYE